MEDRILGPAAIIRAAYRGDDLTALTVPRLARLDAGPDAAAMMDLAMILQAMGGDAAAEGLALMRQALAIRRTYRVVHGDGRGARLLALVTAGDFMANTPVDLLLDGSDWTLLVHFVDAATLSLSDLPPHDALLLAVGESCDNGPVLDRMATLLAGRRVVNGQPDRIAALTRDGVSRSLSGIPGLLAPKVIRLGRQALLTQTISRPFLLRPVGSHAGAGLVRIDPGTDLAPHLETGGAFYAMPFIDYRSADGQFRKARVVFVGGRAFPAHLAISDHWMIHYINAGMATDAGKRAEEARWMAGFDSGFAHRHRTALAAVSQAIGLDYFGIDCAELPDGRLLVFEADTAMVVHAMDDALSLPAKRAALSRLFAAFRDLCLARAG